ncbi:MAG: hypothetical protein IT477_10580 [Rhodanobacteraceae bacterium]|nr:hypothetical protein [Rhodanobacteraceae bacterium]
MTDDSFDRADLRDLMPARFAAHGIEAEWLRGAALTEEALRAEGEIPLPTALQAGAFGYIHGLKEGERRGLEQGAAEAQDAVALAMSAVGPQPPPATPAEPYTADDVAESVYLRSIGAPVPATDPWRWLALVERLHQENHRLRGQVLAAQWHTASARQERDDLRTALVALLPHLGLPLCSVCGVAYALVEGIPESAAAEHDYRGFCDGCAATTPLRTSYPMLGETKARLVRLLQQTERMR